MYCLLTSSSSSAYYYCVYDIVNREQIVFNLNMHIIRDRKIICMENINITEIICSEMS